MNEKISVIVPIYNAEKYIGATLDNLSAQTYKNLEIICVLDCPTDGTEKIVAERADKDGRIKIIRNEKNMDLANTRNIGAAAAAGEYIHFMDADDFVTMDFYETMLAAAVENGADVASCSVFYEKRPRQSVWHKKARAVAGRDKFDKTWALIHGWAWRWLIRREFWNAHNLSFPDLRPMEDYPATVRMVWHANKIALVPNAWYFYKNRENSILNQAKNPETERRHKENRARARAMADDFIKRHKIKRPSKLFMHIWSQLTKY